ncbi:MAG: recombination regulator RecX, partial [Luminiphilus sp.]
MAATTNPADVRRAAMDLLARREHSVEELRQKLARRFGRDQERDQVIVEQLDRLVDEGLLS